jgi:hypothetical protein
VDLVSVETPSAKSQTSLSNRKESNNIEATTRDRSKMSMFNSEKESTGLSIDENGNMRLKEGTMSE